VSAGGLSLERFRALLEAYGARPELWPAAERAAALALRDGSVEARALFEAELGLDVEFAGVVDPELAPDLMRRLNEVPLRAPQKRAWFSLRGLWVPAASWAFAAAVGLGFGLSTEPFGDEADVTTTVASASATAPDTAAPLGDDDITALAGGVLGDFEE
jgi:hypothetical protein